MHTTTGKRSLMLGVGVFAAGLALGAALASVASRATQVVVARGDTLASYLPEEVMSLTYTTERGMITIQRSTPGGAFYIQSTSDDSRPATRCDTPPDMGGHLEQFAEMTVRRGLSLDQRGHEFPVQLGVLDIRTRMIGEPTDPMLVFTNLDHTAVAVILGGAAVEVTLPVPELTWLEKGCDSLAVGGLADRKVVEFLPK